MLDTGPHTRRGWLSKTGVLLSGSFLLRSVANAAASRYQERVLAKKPVGYWRLGDASPGRALDSSGNNRHGIFRGRPVLHEPGAIKSDENSSVKLDGHGCHIEIRDHAAFSVPGSGKGLAVEAWMRPDALEFAGETNEPYIHWLGKGDNGKHEWAFRFYCRGTSRPNRISAYIFNPDGGLGSGAFFEDELTPGEWIHVVACYDPFHKGNEREGVSIYKNGVSRKGPDMPGSSGTHYHQYNIVPVHGSAPLRLGTSATGKHSFTGALDEVAIYPRVLTAAEIKEHYFLGSK